MCLKTYQYNNIVSCIKLEKRFLYLEQDKCLKEGEYGCTSVTPCCSGLICKGFQCKNKDASGNEDQSFTTIPLS